MVSSGKRQSRIEFRVQGGDKELLEQAARLRGQTLSAYALATLMEDARRVIEHANRVEVTLRDHQHFLATLDREEEPAPALVEAARSYLPAKGHSPSDA